MKKINWGIVGYASIAKESGIPAILDSKHSHLYALASQDEEEIQEARIKEPFDRIYGSYEELLEDRDVHAVYIPLPNSLHKEWTVKALEKGKHVLCEKPLGLTEDEVVHMMKRAEEQDRLLMEGFMYRYTPRIQKVMEIVDSGVLGEIRHIDASFRFMMEEEGDIRMNKDLGGGALYDVGSYGVNFLTLLIKKEPISILGTKKVEEGVDVQSTVLFEYENGVTAVIHSGFNSFEKNEAEIIGTQGRLVIPDPFLYNDGTITLYVEGKKEDIYVEPCEKFTEEFEDFSVSILDGKLPLLSLAETRMNARILDRIFAVI